ncbi:MAG: protein translocase subunit SecD [Deltaproteobacteria bacterium]|nr:protein translocase subunit SecD [Deltaproteobacteria bacterium]
MKASWWWRFGLAVGFIGLACYELVPSAIYMSLDGEALKKVQASKKAFEEMLPEWAPRTKITPGLDLQGGVQLVLGVDLQKAIADKAERMTDRLRFDLNDKRIAFESVKRDESGDGDRIAVVFKDKGSREKFDDELLANYRYELTLTTRGDNELRFRISPEFLNSVRKDAVDQAVKTIRNRIDKLGVAEPSIGRRGTDGILVQLPGYGNPDEAKRIIGKTAQLEFSMVVDETRWMDSVTLPAGITLQKASYGSPPADDWHLLGEDKDAILAAVKGHVPETQVVRFAEVPSDGKTLYRTYIVNKRADLTGDYITDARVAQGSPEKPQPYVALDFNPPGATLFEELTGKNVGKRMAIVLEEKVDSAPVIQQKIGGGHCSITLGGMKSAEEILKDAKELTLVLKAGALPAPVTIREERSVGASLGEDAIAKGKWAVGIGVLLVFLFMLFYYRLAGFFSDLALVVNVVFLLAILAMFEATLTLPGLAGLALTVGIAVDANVLINERIREELLLGKTPRAAVEAGYAKAFTAIFDSNVCHILSGAILWQYGSGPVQNFAVTLIIGITTSLYTALVITRLFFDWMVSDADRQTLSI